ncbi:3-oxoacyl-(acyl-carrier-protein) reductase [Desulfurobacterium thermolithotrophum DSM 11699]|uniref:3-oxoacyl-[acyl-carrier-protein] reductase n=1 Tax=Desulfurobacterium thermolithotrophum (strain DSM 11699 / BSA) TaxID=868864 RepID=F0S483_DESTD|nr:3-oxoacyl-[acyl-carrier-protein] reductase [Desulfurobacterium thermolithotrophum]ADY73655.1 3-oxoacyl-(acyl-carrier-protein) reductase [Desulfurobacterium thermolithotrophum DSM 11699]
MEELKGKVVLVTGGTRGIGRAIAERFKEVGATVYITGTNEERTKNVAEEIGVNGVKMNVTDREEVKKVVAEILEKEGQLDVLINNAGITKDTLFLRMKDEDWDSVIDTNLNGVYNVTRAVVPAMIKKKAGNIINISSVVGFTGNIGQVNYSATKSALVGFTKSLAKELGSRGIRVNCIAPGYITTDMTEKIPEKIKQELIKSIPLKREGNPREIADVCLFLASDMASYITGTVIHVNGGLF